MQTAQSIRCGQCGFAGYFLEKTAMRFVTLFFIPILPISGKKKLIECPRCKTRFVGKQQVAVAGATA